MKEILIFIIIWLLISIFWKYIFYKIKNKKYSNIIIFIDIIYIILLFLIFWFWFFYILEWLHKTSNIYITYLFLLFLPTLFIVLNLIYSKIYKKNNKNYSPYYFLENFLIFFIIPIISLWIYWIVEDLVKWL